MEDQFLSQAITRLSDRTLEAWPLAKPLELEEA